MKKQLISIVTVCCLLFSAVFCLPVGAADIVESGSCGENVTYTLDSNGVLTISGRGDMGDPFDYGYWYATPFTENNTVKEIIIGSDVSGIGRGTFRGCYALNLLDVESGNATYHSTENCIIETATKTLIVGCAESVIPDDGSVTTIGYSAFRGCSGLTSVTIPDSVKSIDPYAFAYSAITSVTIGDGVKSIDDYIFLGCNELESIVIPNSVRKIEASAFGETDNLNDIYFTGTEEEWKKIRIGEDNDSLTVYATIHYEYKDPSDVEPTSAEPISEPTSATPIEPTSAEPVIEPTSATPVEPTSAEPVSEPTSATPVEPTSAEPISEPTSASPVEPTSAEPISEPTSVTPVEPTSAEPISEPTSATTPVEPTTEPTTAKPVEPTSAKAPESTTAKTEPSTDAPEPTSKQPEPSSKPAVLRGDADGDGKVNAKDARLVLRASAKLETLTGDAFASADLDGDGKLKASEARKILRYSAKLEKTL